MHIIKVLLIFTLLPLNSYSAKIKADDILGLWLSEEKDGVIKVSKENNEFVGHLVWIVPLDKKQKPEEVLDIANSNKSLRKRKILGLKMLEGFKFEDGSWEDGTIYDPKSGKTYSAKMKLESKDKLKLRGYVGISLFGRSSYWSRVNEIPKN